jgi:hypothetical protein
MGDFIATFVKIGCNAKYLKKTWKKLTSPNHNVLKKKFCRINIATLDISRYLITGGKKLNPLNKPGLL